MAGVLPGVEAARRRGFRPNNPNISGATASKRFSFCLYATSNQEFHFNSHSSLRNAARRAEIDDEILDASAREAKKRLDQRLHSRPEIRRKAKGHQAGKLKWESYFQTNFYKFIAKTG